MLEAHDLTGGEGSAPFQLSTTGLNPGFRETGRYAFILRTDRAKLYIDDEPLPRDDEGRWIWSPGFFAGVVRAEVADPTGATLATYLLDVSPSPDKLGSDTFQQLLRDIWNFEPRLVLGTEPATTQVGELGDLTDPWLEYARVRAHGHTFLRSLRIVARRPLRELKTTRRNVPPRDVRHPDSATLLAALTNPAAIRSLRNQAAEPAQGPVFNVAFTHETLDGAANRYLLAVVRAVAWRIVRLLQQFDERAHSESTAETRTAFRERWPRRREFLSKLLKELGRVQRAEPLRSVSRAETTAAGLNAVSADPAYAQAYRNAWRILRHGVDGPPSAENLWISPTWEVYERWCFVRLAMLLQEAFPDRFKITSGHRSGAAFAACATDAAGNVRELLLQPRFPAWDQSASTYFRSISGYREPDIVLTLTGPSQSSFTVFDAKYRTSRANVLDAMTSAHLYRDALRFNGAHASGAFLLVPAGGGAPWLEDLDFQKEHGVGVLPLSPVGVCANLLEFLAFPPNPSALGAPAGGRL